ncbi:FecR family protein [Roseospirillum parvum]|uniref:FecR protein n=1 Tax=Roseospirillum parvum TaxID=83401 RepID=A0A1G7ZD01_9PROT|nr:FecR domain-containing protein [Roseospirillum parvum]SDH06564.1 FecR protein [Roseospirillum parvum]
MRLRPVSLASAVVAGLIAAPPSATAQNPGENPGENPGQPVGTATLSVNRVEQDSAGQSAPLPEGAPVLFQARLRTGPASANQDALADGTTLTLGPEAEVRLDSFVFDPDTNAGGATLTLVSGALRWASGSMAAGSYHLGTANAAIGIRGTSLVLARTPAGQTVAFVEDGAIALAGTEGPPVEVPAGQAGLVETDGRARLVGALSGPAAATVSGLYGALATLTPTAATLPAPLASALAARAETVRARARTTPAASDPADFGGDGRY